MSEQANESMNGGSIAAPSGGGEPASTAIGDPDFVRLTVTAQDDENDESNA